MANFVICSITECVCIASKIGSFTEYKYYFNNVIALSHNAGCEPITNDPINLDSVVTFRKFVFKVCVDRPTITDEGCWAIEFLMSDFKTKKFWLYSDEARRNHDYDNLCALINKS